MGGFFVGCVMRKNKAKLEIKKNRLKLYLLAEKAILSGQSYEIEGLKLTRADLAAVQKWIAKLENEIAVLSGSRGSRVKLVIPRDHLTPGDFLR